EEAVDPASACATDAIRPTTKSATKAARAFAFPLLLELYPDESTGVASLEITCASARTVAGRSPPSHSPLQETAGFRTTCRKTFKNFSPCEPHSSPDIQKGNRESPQIEGRRTALVPSPKDAKALIERRLLAARLGRTHP